MVREVERVLSYTLLGSPFNPNLPGGWQLYTFVQENAHKKGNTNESFDANRKLIIALNKPFIFSYFSPLFIVFRNAGTEYYTQLKFNVIGVKRMITQYVSNSSFIYRQQGSVSRGARAFLKYFII